MARSKDIRLIAIPRDESNLELAMQLHPEWFVDVGTMSQAGWKVEGVSVPAVSCPYPAS